jgi:hypothetical protein
MIAFVTITAVVVSAGVLVLIFGLQPSGSSTNNGVGEGQAVMDVGTDKGDVETICTVRVTLDDSVRLRPIPTWSSGGRLKDDIVLTPVGLVEAGARVSRITEDCGPVDQFACVCVEATECRESEGG